MAAVEATQAVEQIRHVYKDGERPIYRQLQDLIRGHIAAGTWKPGEVIPSERVLVQEFGVARMTVRQALDGLVHEGLIVRNRGKRTFVAPAQVEREMTRMHSFTEDMRGRGMEASAQLLARRVVPAPEEVASHLLLGRREAVIYLQRLRFADGQPMALETCYLNYDLCQVVLDADLEHGSLYHILEEGTHLALVHATQELQAALPTRAEADLLQVSRRQPVLVIQQTSYMRGPGDERPAIDGRTVYRADRYRFRLDVPR